ncbi:MAG: sugar nucleotide-binding protein [Muribaculaceae bacterium]|nr:sugar nucleotide-binding protein [Muribaculaceae bacterium]
MKFLIMGCNGMAGHTISLYLSEQGHEVLGFDKKKSNLIRSVSGDARNIDQVRDLIKNGGFDTIINSIGILNQYAEENKALATYLNSYLPHLLVDLTAGTDTQVIHMSTDCVFSGEKGQYTEDDFKDGKTFYDRSKALGEIEDEKNITLRNSIVGPDVNPKGIGLLNWFMQQDGEIKGFTRSIWTGQTTLQLAKTMEAAAMERAHGLYNTVPNESISKYELVKLFNKYLRNDKLIINPVEGVKADKSLKRTRFEFNYLIPDYEEMISEMAKWVIKHKSLYPHYNL